MTLAHLRLSRYVFAFLEIHLHLASPRRVGQDCGRERASRLDMVRVRAIQR
jgi:hypothetical protein